MIVIGMISWRFYRFFTSGIRLGFKAIGFITESIK